LRNAPAYEPGIVASKRVGAGLFASR
jgi:hypothetical protein